VAFTPSRPSPLPQSPYHQSLHRTIIKHHQQPTISPIIILNSIRAPLPRITCKCTNPSQSKSQSSTSNHQNQNHRNSISGVPRSTYGSLGLPNPP
jgi:hypothetical protein